MRQVGIRVIDGFDKVHPWVLVVQLKERVKNPFRVVHRRVFQICHAHIQRRGDFPHQLFFGFAGIVFILSNADVRALFIEADRHSQLLHRHPAEIPHPFDSIPHCHSGVPP